MNIILLLENKGEKKMRKKLKIIAICLLLAIGVNIIKPVTVSASTEQEDESIKWDYRLDVNNDCRIDKDDLNIVAKSYNTVPNDLNWYEECDINRDKIINIYDIVLVARGVGLSINESAEVSPKQVVERMDEKTKNQFLITINSIPELAEYYNSIEGDLQYEINMNLYKATKFSSTNSISQFSFLGPIPQLYYELKAIELPTPLIFTIMASASSVMAAISEGALPIGKICALITGTVGLFIFIYYWDEIQDKYSEILSALKKVFYQIASTIEEYYDDFIHYVESKKHTNSAGEEVERKLVNDQDELLEEAEKAAGGDLDNCNQKKENRWVTKDGQTEIEWEPNGHSYTNEGPHVTIQKLINGKMRVVEKIFIKGWETYKRSYH